ncbi:glycosyltransferase [Gluconobacter oxydans H24]|nr:glycosyltransferase [Gluconobacter oxydans H24]
MRFLYWMASLFGKNKSTNKPLILLSHKLERRIAIQLGEFQKNFTSYLRNTFTTDTETNDVLLSCYCSEDTIPDRISSAMLVVGKNFYNQTEFTSLSDCIHVRIPHQDSTLSFLSDASESTYPFRQKLRQILTHDLEGRLARNTLSTTLKNLHAAETATHALRIESRLFSEQVEDFKSKNISISEKLTNTRKQLEQSYAATQQDIAVFNAKLISSHTALEALKDFLQHPAPLWRRLARALRTPFVPYVPTLPETLTLRDFRACNTETLPDLTPNPTETVCSDAPSPKEDRPSSKGIKRILFVAGEPHTPGVVYRCHRNAEAARHAGFEARIQDCAVVSYDDIHWADVMILWRVEYSGHVSTILDLARQEGVRTIFDIDDIIIVPHYARVDLIDGIRSTGENEGSVARLFADMRRTFVRCDHGSTTTRELARAMHEVRPVVHLLPNTYDKPSLHRARLSRRLHEGLNLSAAGDTLIRIGYTTGTRTHQRDFAIAVPAIAHVLKMRPNVRLVLFRDKQSQTSILAMEEFPELRGLGHQIEWRETVPLSDLPDEFGRLDISIAPLEVGNVFCEAKSEIKFLEASLAGSASVVSPTGPFKRLVRHGETGFLADTPEEWTTALLTLIDNPGLRQRMARDAYHDVLWPFSPQAQARRIKLAFSSLGSDEDVAETGELVLARDRQERRNVPVIPESETLFHHDTFAEADVTVVITSYNYSAYILDALNSVSAQSLSQLDLIVVDDGSTDGSVDLVRIWMERNTSRFNRLLLRRSVRNAGLGGARNIGMDAAETEYVLHLDADNLLRPEACEKLHAAMTFGIAYAYPVIQCFNENGPAPIKSQEKATDISSFAVMGDLPFHPLNFVGGNHVDAMAMVAKWAWAAAGGYYVSREAMGWEDFDLWCVFAELGLPGRQVREILADYREHSYSMTNMSTERAAHKARVVEYIKSRHPWINLTAEAPVQRL